MYQMEALYLILDFIHTPVCVYHAKSIVGCGEDGGACVQMTMVNVVGDLV